MFINTNALYCRNSWAVQALLVLSKKIHKYVFNGPPVAVLMFPQLESCVFLFGPRYQNFGLMSVSLGNCFNIRSLGLEKASLESTSDSNIA